MSQERRTAPPATGSAAATASNLTDEAHPQSIFHGHLMAAAGRLVALAGAEHIDPDTGDRHIKVKPYLTLKPAEAAVLRAWDRGQRAEVIVCMLVPVTVGGDL